MSNDVLNTIRVKAESLDQLSAFLDRIVGPENNDSNLNSIDIDFHNRNEGDNRGIKWPHDFGVGAKKISETEAEFTFETKWSPPTPFFAKLSFIAENEFPNIRLRLDYFEGMLHYCGYCEHLCIDGEAFYLYHRSHLSHTEIAEQKDYIITGPAYWPRGGFGAYERGTLSVKELAVLQQKLINGDFKEDDIPF